MPVLETLVNVPDTSQLPIHSLISPEYYYFFSFMGQGGGPCYRAHTSMLQE